MTDASRLSGEGAIMIPPEIVALAAGTLDEIDPPAWGPVPVDATSLVRRAHALRTVPFGRLGVEDLRVLIGQDVAREILVPLALGMLRHRPLLEGDFYPGDLLMAVMRVPDSHWNAHPDQLDMLREGLSRLDRNDAAYPHDDDEFEAAVARLRPGAGLP